MNNYNQVLLSKFEDGVLVIPISSIVDRPLKELLKFKEDTGYDFTSLRNSDKYVGNGRNGLILYRHAIFPTYGRSEIEFPRETAVFSSLLVDTPLLNSLISGRATLEISSIGELSIRERIQLAKMLNVTEEYLKEMYEKFNGPTASLDIKHSVVCKGISPKVLAREVLKELYAVETYTREYAGVSLDEIKD